MSKWTKIDTFFAEIGKNVTDFWIELKDKVITLGDQLMTDIFGSSRMKLDSILVHPIKKKSEHWYTRLNRRMEKFVVSRIKKKYPMVFKELEEKHEY